MGDIPDRLIIMDGAFAALRDDFQLLSINVNLVDKDKHVPQVER
jgi:hypothetical protein